MSIYLFISRTCAIGEHVLEAFIQNCLDGLHSMLCNNFERKRNSPKKNVKIRAYSEPLIREIAEKQIRLVIDNS